MNLDFLRCCIRQTVDLGNGCPPLAEGGPTILGLAPDVEVGVDKHHDGTDGPSTLEQKNPATVEEEKHSKTELDSVAKRSYVINPVVKRLP